MIPATRAPDTFEVKEKRCQIKPWKIFEKMQIQFFLPIFASFEPFFLL